MKQKWLLVAGAAGVLALLGGLVFLLRDGGASAASPSEPAAAPSAPSPTAAAPSPRPAPSRPTPTAPAPGARLAAPAPDEPPPRERRDHRGQGPTGAPSPIQPETTGALRGALTPVMKQCSARLRDANPPKNGYLFATFKATVRGGRVFMSDVTIQQREINDPDVVACAQRAFEQLVVTAPEGQPDGTDRMGMGFNVP